MGGEENQKKRKRDERYTSFFKISWMKYMFLIDEIGHIKLFLLRRNFTLYLDIEICQCISFVKIIILFPAESSLNNQLPQDCVVHLYP